MRKLILLFLITITVQKTMAQLTHKISDKQIIKTVIIDEPKEKVWWRWTTHEGLKTFFGKDNKIELTPGGAYEIYFLMYNPVGQKGGEGCKVLSVIPNQMLSFTWNAPPQFKEIRESLYQTWVVVNFEAVSDKQTKVTLTHLGWPEDEKWLPVYEYFILAWDTVFNWLTNETIK